MSFTIREMDRSRDRPGVEAIDTAFDTDVVFDLVTTARRIELVERRLERPLTKRYPMGEPFASWARWDTAWVAEDAAGTGPSAICGFAAAGHEEWHARIVLWFLHVAPAWRRRGVARALLGEVEAYGRCAGASHVWLETQTVNLPGIAAYERLGYSLCGTDSLLYGNDVPGEMAVFLAKPLSPAGG